MRWTYFFTFVCNVSSCLQQCKNYKNRVCFSRVMITNVLPRFFSVHSVLAVKRFDPRLQSACRRHHSTETVLLRVLSDILCAADRQHVTLKMQSIAYAIHVIGGLAYSLGLTDSLHSYKVAGRLSLTYSPSFRQLWTVKSIKRKLNIVHKSCR